MITRTEALKASETTSDSPSRVAVVITCNPALVKPTLTNRGANPLKQKGTNKSEENFSPYNVFCYIFFKCNVFPLFSIIPFS